MSAVQLFFVLIKQVSEAGSLAFLQEANFSCFLWCHYLPGVVLSKEEFEWNVFEY